MLFDFGLGPIRVSPPLDGGGTKKGKRPHRKRGKNPPLPMIYPRIMYDIGLIIA